MEKKEQRCISTVLATVLALMGIDIPKEIELPDEEILEKAKQKFGDQKIEKTVLYNPDAVALWLYDKYPEIFLPAKNASDLALPRTSVMPSVTPVCFASMYTGLMPEIHGIQKYEKPVLKVDTLFDYALRAGKKCVIVSTAGDSISKIFLERNMEYYIYPTLTAVNIKAKQLIKKGDFDILVIYNGNYDSTMHSAGPEAKKSLRALKHNIGFYSSVTSLIHKSARGKRTFYGFCPDHGCHLIDGNRGSHGLNMEEDMNVIHFYGFAD